MMSRFYGYNRIVNEELPLSSIELAGEPPAMPELPDDQVLVCGHYTYNRNSPDDDLEELQVCQTQRKVSIEWIRHIAHGSDMLNWYTLDVPTAERVGLIEEP